MCNVHAACCVLQHYNLWSVHATCSVQCACCCINAVYYMLQYSLQCVTLSLQSVVYGMILAFVVSVQFVVCCHINSNTKTWTVNYTIRVHHLVVSIHHQRVSQSVDHIPIRALVLRLLRLDSLFAISLVFVIRLQKIKVRQGFLSGPLPKGFLMSFETIIK